MSISQFAVTSVRQTSCKKGYPYFATGLYRIRYARAGHMVWELSASAPEASTIRAARNRHNFTAPYVAGVRHNARVTIEQLAALKRHMEQLCR